MRGSLTCTLVFVGLGLSHSLGCGESFESGQGASGGSGGNDASGGSGAGDGSAGSGGSSEDSGVPSTGGSTAQTGGAPGSGGITTIPAEGGVNPVDAATIEAGGCSDGDGDGVDSCSDCDDGDPATFPGAAEICGDAVDNDCNQGIDDGCNGTGTWVSQLVGDDTNPGTQAAPVQTIAQGMAIAATLGGADVYVAEGDYAEKVVLAEGIGLLGGYQCDQNQCGWSRDRATYTSTITDVDAEGLLASHTITRATVVDGFTIVGATGLATGRGRAAVTLNGGTPTLTNNRIEGPDVTTGGYLVGRSQALLILSPSNDAAGAFIDGNTILGGNTSSEPTNGILMETAPGAAQGPSVAVISNNRIVGGTGRSSSALTAWSSGPGTVVSRNVIVAGQSTDTSTSGSAWAVIVGSELLIDRNHINTDPMTANCQNTIFCGGIKSESSTMVVTNNVVFGVDGPHSAAVYLGEFERPAGEVRLNSNYLDGGGNAAGARSAALVVTIGACTTCGFNGRVGRVRNNIVAPGQAPTRFGVLEDPWAGRVQHVEIFENNLLFMTARPATGDALYQSNDGVNATPHTTLAAVNGLSFANTTFGGNLQGDPLLDATFHLGAGSPALEVGTAAEAPLTDMDGQTRPRGLGYDIGPDER